MAEVMEGWEIMDAYRAGFDAADALAKDGTVTECPFTDRELVASYKRGANHANHTRYQRGQGN